MPALAARDTGLVGVFGSFDIDAVGGAGRGAQETGHALLQAVLVALQHVDAAKALLELGRLVGIILRHGGRHHLLKCDAHPLCNCGGGTQNIDFIGHGLFPF